MRLLSRLLPPLALMAVIYLASDTPGLSTGLGSWDLLVRKLAHMTEYALLWVLLWRALGWRPANAGVAVLLTVLYACSDEWHQTWVEGRHGTPWDVLVDTAGIGLAASVLVPALRRSDRTRSEEPAASGDDPGS